MTLLLKWLLSAFAIFLVSMFLPGFHVESFSVALIASFILGIINVTIRPLCKLLVFPITLLTFGLFIFIINGAMLLIVDFFVDALTIDGLWWAVLSAILITFVTAIGERIVLGSDGKFGDKK